MPGAADDLVLQKGEEEGRILITLDKGFGELVYRLHQIHAGVVLCRVQSLPIEDAVALVEKQFQNMGLVYKVHSLLFNPETYEYESHKL